MIEPSTSSVATAVATISAFTATVLGVQYLALIWAFVGALVALGQAPPMTRWKAVAFILLSTLVGAALGHGFIAIPNVPSSLLILASAVGGFGSQALLASLLARANNAIRGAKNDA